MRADDDGFVNKPKTIMRMCGCKDDDIKSLFERKFLIPFDSGVVVIKHWKIHNYIAKDRYKETKYKEEKATLLLDENNSYTQCIQVVDETETQVRLGKDRLGKDNNILCASNDAPTEPGSKNKRFVKPSVDEIRAYCNQRSNNIDPQRFYDYYESNGWKVGRNAMKDWKAAVRTWETKDKGANGNAVNRGNAETDSTPERVFGTLI